MRYIISSLFSLFLFYSCTPDPQEEPTSSEIRVTWGLEENRFQAEPAEYAAWFLIDNQSGQELTGDWELRFNAYFGQLKTIDAGYDIANVTGEHFRLFPTDSTRQIASGESDTIHYVNLGSLVKEAMSPGGFFLVVDDEVVDVNWSRKPMDKQAAWGSFGRPDLMEYDDAVALYDQYPEAVGTVVNGPRVTPLPNDIQLLTSGVKLCSYQASGEEGQEQETSQEQGNEQDSKVDSRRLHIWTSGALWYKPAKVFKEWMGSFYGVEVVRHEEEKPDFPHLELIYDTNLGPETYEIFNMGADLTVISAGSTSGMMYGLATVVQSLEIEDGHLTLPLEKVVDTPRFGYRGFMLDVSRNFHSKESVLKLLDLMALHKLNRFHFHLTDDEGWRLEIPGLPELTTVGANRGYTEDEYDNILPAYMSGGHTGVPSGSGHYSTEDFVEILKYAAERDIQVIPEFDLPGHARAAIKAMEAYARRTGDDSYLLSEAGDTSRYKSIQDYPDNTIVVCQESTYKFLEKVVEETAKLYEAADLELEMLHTGGDEVAGGVWTGSPRCMSLLEESGVATDNPELGKNFLSAYFLQRFRGILAERNIRTAGWEEIGMERVKDESGNYRYVVNPKMANDNMLPYVWNSLGDNVDLAYEMANAGYEVVICNVNSLYFDLAYSTDPAEPGLFWGGFIDTYSPWAFAPLDVVKTAPSPWHSDGPTEAELRSQTQRLRPDARKNIAGIQGQLWSETVIGEELMERYLWPKMFGLAERAWSAPAIWESTENEAQRKSEMAAGWAAFTTRIGHHSLPLLDRYAGGEGINYRLPPAAGKIVEGKLMVRTKFPGLDVYYQIGDGKETLYKGAVDVPGDEKVMLWTGRGERRSYVSYVGG